MKRKSLGVLIAGLLGASVFAGSVAQADWVGSGWMFAGFYSHQLIPNKRVDYWVNTNPWQITRSFNMTNQTPHWAATECLEGFGLPVEYVFDDMWSGAAGGESNLTPFCPDGFILWRGGTFVFDASTPHTLLP